MSEATFKTSNEVKKYLTDTFGPDIVIRDAKEELRIQPIPEDAVNADPKDSFNCFFVHSVKRMYGSTVVIFWKTIAYLDLVDPDGVRRVYRYACNADVMKRTAAFDRGEPFPRGSAIILKPPLGFNKLTIKSRANRKRLRRHFVVQQKAEIAYRRAKARHAKVEEQFAKVMANEKQSGSKKVEAIKKQKMVTEKAVKQTTIKLAQIAAAKKKREPIKFDLTTRNGALGRYHIV